MKKQPLTPRHFAQRFLLDDKGRPLDYAQRPYFHDLLDQKEKQLVLMTARQVGKSTFLMIKILFRALLFRKQKLLFATAEHAHLNHFRKGRMAPQFARHTQLYPYITLRENNKEFQTFSNASQIFYRAIANNPECVRGLSAFAAYFDETQIIPEEGIVLALEILSQYAREASIILAGTAGALWNGFTQRWEASQQYEWLITCCHCKKENEPIGMDHLDRKRPFLFCQFCGKKMDPRRGHWVAMNPKGAIPGYRIPRLLEPTALWRSEAQTGILDKWDTFPIERFKTEEMAIPSGEVRQFFDYEKVLACCGDYTCYSTENLPQYYPGKRTIITIDWAVNVDWGGQSFTVLTVWDPNHSRLRLVAAKRFQGAAYDNIETLRNELVMICRRFSPKIIAVDHAMGDALTKDLIRILKTKVVRIHYTGNTASLRWSQTNKFYTVNKTEAMEALSLAIERKIFEFPQDETFRDFLLEFTHVAVDHNHNRTRRLMVRKGGPDDFVQCAAYALLMGRHIVNNSPFYELQQRPCWSL